MARGDYSSASEVVRAALRALDREERTFDAMLKAKVQEALDDLSPLIPAEEVFARLERKFAAEPEGDI